MKIDAKSRLKAAHWETSLSGVQNQNVIAFVKELASFAIVRDVLTNGYQDFDVSGCEIHFTGKQSDLVGGSHAFMHPGELDKLSRLVDKYSKKDCELAFGPPSHGSDFVMIILGEKQ